MTRIDPVWATVAELSRAFDERMLSPVDVVEALLARIRARDGALHAYIAVYEADARLAAEAADKAIRSGHRVGPLHGVPIALKDLVDMQGRVTTGGSKVWQNRVSPVTATLAERLIGAGMIVLGKTHTVEFAMGSFGTNTHMGTPRNPWDLGVHRTPGGSLQRLRRRGRRRPGAGGHRHRHRRLGAAAGRLVRHRRPQGHRRADQHARRAAAQHHARHAGAAGPLRRGRGAALQRAATVPTRAIRRRWRGRRPTRCPRCGAALPACGWPSCPRPSERGVADEVLAAYDASVEVLAGLGARIVARPLPHRFTDYAAATGRIIGAEGYRFVGDLVDDMSLPVDPHVRPRIQLGRNVSRARLPAHAGPDATRTATEFAAALTEADALLTPTAQTAALPIDKVDQSGTAAHFTRAGNYLGLCGARRPQRLHASRACRPPCRSSVTRATKRPRCASAGPTSKPPTGTRGVRLRNRRQRFARSAVRLRRRAAWTAGRQGPLRFRERLPGTRSAAEAWSYVLARHDRSQRNLRRPCRPTAHAARRRRRRLTTVFLAGSG